MVKKRKKKTKATKSTLGVNISQERPESIHLKRVKKPEKHPHLTPRPKHLGQLYATAICGNDITSSCLYVAAICTVFAGKLAPVCLLIVATILYLYKSVYSEVGDALPLNGGAYNALLNSTTKFKAAMAACMTILSYIATAVISATTATHYFAHAIFPVPVIPVTIVILGMFTFLAIIGISESARVALAIFLFHMFTLAIFTSIGIYLLVNDPSILWQNWQLPLPKGRNILLALFFGVSSGLLGISGFESSANFIEEQAEGVFVKTLRNMWFIVSFFNPVIAFLALAILPIPTIEGAKDFLLSDMASVMIKGKWLNTMVGIDATLVLCGAVLTSFVGVGGLMRRMALDRCLPQYLLKENRRGTTHRIFLVFFLLCTSIIILTKGKLLSLAGVYTISFLGVMTLFAIGNILLKVRRSKLKRNYRAGWVTVILAMLATITGMIGNILIDKWNFYYFLIYFIPTVIVVGIMFLRTKLLALVYTLVNEFSHRVNAFSESVSESLQQKIDEINSHGIIFFTKGDHPANLNKAMLYVSQNELTKNLAVILMYEKDEDIPPNLKHDLEFLDTMYPEIKIELILKKGRFSPESVDKISKEFGIPKNYMFIGAPGESFPHNLNEFGGVRLII